MSTADGPIDCARARTMAEAVLSTMSLPARAVDDVLVVVSELVGNARRHAGGATAFTVTARTGTLTVTVSDTSSRVPELQAWAPERAGGFGWRLVNDLTDALTIRLHPGGKTITATFSDKQLRPEQEVKAAGGR
ncbi:ATP-binding protein [Streptomyces vinaceus]|uniref:ATP-binding protein n=1 Tax=Streptomyces vinaceus TaxID=1960 RepID=UPI00380262EF